MPTPTPLLDAGGYLQFPEYVSSDLCQTWTAAIHENRARWLKRRGGYSYGRGWYLDIGGGLLDQYHARAEHTNELIRSTLPGLLERLTGFAAHLVSPDGETGLPARPRRANLGPYWCDAGVHIMGGDAATEYKGGEPPHADYEGLSPYVATMFDENTRAYTAILSLQAPAWGLGLDVWDQQRYTAAVIPRTVFVRFGERTEASVSLDYAPGTLTAIDSFLYHALQRGGYSAEQPWRMVAVIHFLFLREPYPHWEHWF